MASFYPFLASQGKAILNTLQQFAGAIGNSIAAMIVAASQLGLKNAARTALGTQHAFFVLIALCLITWLSYWRYVRDKLFN